MQALSVLIAVFIATVSGQETLDSCWRKANPELKFTSSAGADFINGMGMKLLASRPYCNNPDIVDVFVANDNSTEGIMCVRTQEAQIKYCGAATSCCKLAKKSTVELTPKVETSDEKSPASCPQDTFLRKLTCTGSHCDNVSTECAAMKGLKFGKTAALTDQISDANFKTTGFCPNGTVATGFSCRNSDCAIVTLECRDVVDEKGTAQKFADKAEQGCVFTPNFSEEGVNTQSCANNFYVRGLSCSGSNCDNMNLYCCPKF